MNAVEIEQAISELAEQTYNSLEFPFQFLMAFGNKETTIQKLRKGNSNKSDIPNGILQRNNIHIATCETGEVARTLNTLKSSPANAKGKVKFILATDGDELQSEDLTSGETIACDYTKFANHFGFFLPLAGISTVKQIRDNPIDIQATSRLNRLYVELLRTNEDWATTERRQDMNQFMGRLIFCYFAEDTNIFNGDNLFTKTVEQMSDSKTDNTDYVLKELFRSMDTPFKDRDASDIPRWADTMPYVNGGLFAGTRDVPKFTRAARSYLLHAGSLNWKEINPDIFGSMIQAVADDEERGALGMHYTSVPNILKVLNPLFLDELREQLDEAGDNGRKLLNLKKRMARIRVFDPACGSGNFLVIAYKEMREIEFKVNQSRREEHLRSEIPLSNFRGIELRQFPTEIARLSLIIAEFQCDVLYRGQKEALNDFLPLDRKNWIVCNNALEIDWLSICPPTGTSLKFHGDDLFNTPLDQNEIEFENEGGETFICGNPPYKGSSYQSNIQKKELKVLFSSLTSSWKNLDYIAGWFLKASYFCKFVDSSFAFVSTNSICQGQQIPMIWPLIFNNNQEIIFAHQSFKWSNLASHNAGVIVIVVGVSKKNKNIKKLYFMDKENRPILREVENINAYLLASKSVIVESRRSPCGIQSNMVKGNQPTDGGYLILSSDEAKTLRSSFPLADQFIYRYVGSQELIKGQIRYCLWINDEKINEAKAISKILSRLEKVTEFRKNSKSPTARTYSSFPHKFIQIQSTSKKYAIVIPKVSSNSREYLPFDLLDSNSIISDLAFAIYDAPIWNIAILASKLHLAWISMVCGRLGDGFRYSSIFGWNTFPIPTLTVKNRVDLTNSAKNILIARESFFPATMSDLYKPEDMPDILRKAHEINDQIIERIYIGRVFKNDTERMEKLFDHYSKIKSKFNLNERVS